MFQFINLTILFCHNSVDHGTDLLMQRIIREEWRDRTVIAVMHRLEALVNFDMVAVLSEGRLVEYAPPSELLARPSAFKTLFESSP